MAMIEEYLLSASTRARLIQDRAYIVEWRSMEAERAAYGSTGAIRFAAHNEYKRLSKELERIDRALLRKAETRVQFLFLSLVSSIQTDQ